jgi:membrane associated rhomboid family serine protease
MSHNEAERNNANISPRSNDRTQQKERLRSISTEIMNEHDAFQLEMEEPFAIRVEEPHSTRKYTISSWFQRILTLDDVPNQKHHFPVFIIVMSVLHVFMYLLTYIDTSWKGQDFADTLFDLFQFFVPCMRPAPHDIRTRIVNCPQSMKNETCHYEDVLKHMCFSFTYPHQIWRMISVNLLHMHWLHLLSNLLAQLLQGIPLERKYGSVRVAIIYWLSGLGASLSYMMKNIGECKYNV